jgi:hypothetical protein
MVSSSVWTVLWLTLALVILTLFNAAVALYFFIEARYVSPPVSLYQVV